MSGILLSVVWGGLIVALATAAGYYWRKRHHASLARRLGQSISVCHRVFAALEHVPADLISRDLRRGLVLLVSFHADRLQQTSPQHPYLSHLQQKVARLNQIPSGLKRSRVRSKQSRKQTSLALESIAKTLAEAVKQGALSQKAADLARASALLAAQQIAVENAWQAAKDAEHVRAYPRALQFAHHAKALSKRLPPMLSQSLGELIDADIERLEQHSQPLRAAR